LVVRGLPIAEIGDRACAAGIALHELTPESGSLEDLFMGWTENDKPHDQPKDVPEFEREVVPL
jgi:ABC-2 type transport system ATP-binding protein